MVIGFLRKQPAGTSGRTVRCSNSGQYRALVHALQVNQTKFSPGMKCAVFACNLYQNEIGEVYQKIFEQSKYDIYKVKSGQHSRVSFKSQLLVKLWLWIEISIRKRF